MIKHSEAVVFYGSLVSDSTVEKIERYMVETDGKKRAEILISLRGWELDYAIYYLSLKSRWQEYTQNLFDLSIAPLLHLLAVRCVKSQRFKAYKGYYLSSSQLELMEDLIANILSYNFAINGRSHFPFHAEEIREIDDCISAEAIEFLFRQAIHHDVQTFSDAKCQLHSEKNKNRAVRLSPKVGETFETMLWLNNLLYGR